jgi:hypothetical protein
VARGPRGVFVRVSVLPNQERAWFCAGVVGSEAGYVLCRDHDLALPAEKSVLELRGGSLWTHAICETPLEHWTVAMEAYALAFDDPLEAVRSERGDRIGLAFDLEWECEPEALRWSNDRQDRYDGWCTVHGTLQVGDEEWSVAAQGSRHHAWGLGADVSGEPNHGIAEPVTGTDIAIGGGSRQASVAPFLSEGPEGPMPMVAWCAADRWHVTATVR